MIGSIGKYSFDFNNYHYYYYLTLYYIFINIIAIIIIKSTIEIHKLCEELATLPLLEITGNTGNINNS